ncbi:MAG: DUF547 domain-containing protein [Fidelibacterota bacterium]
MIVAIVLTAVMIGLMAEIDPRVGYRGKDKSVEESAEAYGSLDAVLSTFVNGNGRVDYEALRENPGELTRFIEFLKSASPENRPDLFETENDRKAYWINAYNALVIKEVVDHPGISSVKEVGWGLGVFWRKTFVVGGRRMNLNHIEHRILRKRFRDPRIHFVINCASESCPPLGNRIVTGDGLDEELHRKAAAFIQDSNHVRIDHGRKEIRLSRIFRWYRKDFTAAGESLQAYVLRYLPRLTRDEKESIATEYRIRFSRFGWELNSQDPPQGRDGMDESF